jgi:hypothetical protein
MLGDWEAGTARLEEAVVAFRKAPEERTRKRFPLPWAGTQNKLGNALRLIGERKSETVWLEEAVNAYYAAISVFALLQRAEHNLQFCYDNRERALTLLAQLTKP